ncbi:MULTISPECIES: hypothetical protein [unclassified Nocardia]|uniref:hypothetical protein n=1 Tax=unclassified Nocardia TaxID=2637762 RepID=UPI001CE41AE6|nr:MULTISPECIES: hypothetical protein [unclassified Nocardia]
MKITKFALAAAFMSVAVGVAAGASSAEINEGRGIGVTARTADGASIIETDSGTMVVEDGVFKVKDGNGAMLAGTPLKFRLDDFEFPIAATISGHTATLTPQLDMAHAAYKPVALPFEDTAPWKTPYDREKDAWSRMTGTVSLGASIAAIVGGIGGAAVGCVLGGSLGAVAALGTIVGLFGPFLPAAVVGCLAGAVIAAPLGAIAAQFVITAPVAIAAAVQYFSTINSPMPNKAK